ncbi:MAG: carboxypeptidase-like regulatory domain-containing protein [Planctomycetales bacterium]
MLIGYVSDENYVALADVLLEFERNGNSWEARSRATGAIHADVPPGLYRVTLAKQGYGAKRVEMRVDEATPHHFRLLSDRLLGYPWPKWVRSGETAEFRVHSPEQYHLSLWRYGWQKELVRELGWFDEHGPRATVQILPDGDFTQTGVQWNKQGYSNSVHAQRVEGPARSGLYYFHAKTPSGLFSSFPWIVAPARPQAKVAVILANITWNAYNNFGGRSNYINADRLLSVPTVNSRQDLPRYSGPDANTYSSWTYDPLSFDRPEIINHVPETDQVTDPIEGRTACHLAPAEWRLLGWLEREGIPHDVYAETQLQSGVLKLDDYQQVILGPHPEYWSRKMYFELKSWIQDRGGKLLYLGGNGLNCEVDFLDEHTIVVQNGDERDRIRKQECESRFATRVESEANLLGVVFDYEGIMTSAPFKVVDEGHWVFADTGLKEGDLFGTQSLHKRCPGGASGHETDKVSKHSPANVVKLAKGQNPGQNGGADMTIYETASGGSVFAAGSITWCSSLLVDEAVSKITLNVLRHHDPAL